MPHDWHKSPINELGRKLMRTCPITRASVNDIVTSNDIYVGATHADAIDFVNDIELIDYIKMLGSSARAWYS